MRWAEDRREERRERERESGDAKEGEGKWHKWDGKAGLRGAV